MDLCRRVEETLGLHPATPSQFEVLAERIHYRTGTLISATTLKRLWGYLNEPLTPRRTTLDVLARCSGWPDYEAFLAGDTPELESGAVGTKVIRVERDLRRGDRIKVMWHPSRVCVIQYLGDGAWKVLAAEKTRLTQGDTFRCNMLISGEPMYLDDLSHNTSTGGLYVCGSRSGITFERVKE